MRGGDGAAGSGSRLAWTSWGILNINCWKVPEVRVSLDASEEDVERKCFRRSYQLVNCHSSDAQNGNEHLSSKIR